MKNSLFANGLIVVIGVLMLLAALQLFGWGKGTSSLEPEGFDASALTQLEVLSEDLNKKVGPELVSQINTMPLFNLDRKRYEGVMGGEDDEPPPVVIESKPLKAKVTSIIMIGDDRYAMMVDQVTNEKITLEQGMPLPGEQGLWVVDQIEARQVTFVAEGEEPVSLELEVFDGTLNGKSRSTTNTKNNRNKTNTEQIEKVDASVAKKNSAEEIRKKIAERRAQMRANAAKGKKE
ncbi:hypothetical protein [Marinicella litoralis]|nr:hypothetical protein [Marinicella litoralis]